MIILLLAINIYGQLPPETPWNNPYNAHKNMDLPNPGYLETVHDPMFGVDITRIGDKPALTGSVLHAYSKVQAWNSNMSLIWLGFNNVLKGTDYGLFKTIDVSMKDARWSNTEPNIRYYGGGDYLRKLDVITEEVTNLHEFSGYGPVTIGPWEGNISADDRYVVVTKISGDAGVKAAVYDIKNDTVLGEKEFPNRFDWASVTPWGDYIVINEFDEGEFDEHGFSGDGATNLYDLNLNFVRKLSDRRAHADFAIDTEGNRVFVEMCDIRMINIETGEITDLLPKTKYTKGTCEGTGENPWICGHASGRNFGLDGWILISAGYDKCHSCGDCDGYHNLTEIFLLKLDGSGTVRHLGFTRSSFGSYNAEAKAVVSPDGTKAIFTSDWHHGGDKGGIVDYVVEFNPKGSHTISTNIGEGSGSIELIPEGNTFTEGTLITATAVPDNTTAFSSWEGYISGTDNPIYFRLPKDTILTANFTEAYALNITVVGSGHVVPSVNKTYPVGTVKTITAYPTNGSEFLGWSGDISSTDNPVKVTMDADKNIIATFSNGTDIEETIISNSNITIYPNPASDNATIKYSVSKESKVRLSLYNTMGQEVDVLVNKNQQQGEYSVAWHDSYLTGSPLSNGVYFIKLQVDDNFVEVQRFLINK